MFPFYARCLLASKTFASIITGQSLNSTGKQVNVRLLRPMSSTESEVPVSTMKLDTPEFRNLFTPELSQLREVFQQNNYELRLAGGPVRDLLLQVTGMKPSIIIFHNFQWLKKFCKPM